MSNKLKQQQENEALLNSIYTPEKKKIWKKKMNLIGKRFCEDKISFTEYVRLRAELRLELGFPA